MTAQNLDLKATTYEVRDRVAIITLNRPDRGNAWTGRMHADYRACLAAAAVSYTHLTLPTTPYV